ncbi:MAG: alanine:cation symporter family protein, partial [Firmicutes bacterium]|nr:alanine:cation symporter family protein [Bacillota bacterium]
FWMWIIAFFGMATVYAEAVLAQETRVKDADGTVLGGPVYYIQKAFPGVFGKALAAFFAAATILALGFMGAMVQANSIGEACSNAFGIPAWIIGLFVCVIASLIFIGGSHRVASVTEKLVPVMAGLYLIGGAFLLATRIQYLPETIGMIFKYAFMPDAIIGGGFGYALKTAISQGAKRGLFSNEAGMGSTPHAHALANVKRPHEQGTVAMVSVFIDTFIVLTMTALIVISTLYAGDGILASGSANGIEKTNMAQIAFSMVFGDSIGSAFVAGCLFFFAFSTIISWNLFGKLNTIYLFGKKAVMPYTVIAIAFMFLGSTLSNNLVWELTDMFNQLMVVPNVLALFALSGMVIAECRDAAENQDKEIRDTHHRAR